MTKLLRGYITFSHMRNTWLLRHAHLNQWQPIQARIARRLMDRGYKLLDV